MLNGRPMGAYDWSLLPDIYTVAVADYQCMLCLTHGEARPTQFPRWNGCRRRNFICFACWNLEITEDGLEVLHVQTDDLPRHTALTTGVLLDTLMKKIARVTDEGAAQDKLGMLRGDLLAVMSNCRGQRSAF